MTRAKDIKIRSGHRSRPSVDPLPEIPTRTISWTSYPDGSARLQVGEEELSLTLIEAKMLRSVFGSVRAEGAREGENPALAGAPPRLNGCHNRPPVVAAYPLTGGGMQNNVFAEGPDNGNCKYTLSGLGRVDTGCTGCRWKRAS